jgi:hypothetical protein
VCSSDLDLERLPLYEVVVNEEDDFSGLKYISLVEDPAIEVRGVAFAKKRYDLQPNDYDSRWYTHPNCNCSFADGVWSVVPSGDGEYPCDICIDTAKKYEDWYRKRGEGSSSAPSAGNFSKMEFKVQKDKQIIVGPTMIPDKKIYRQDESGMEYMVTFSKETIRKMVQKFVRENNNRSINLEHTNQMVPAFIMEHWIVEDSTYDKSKIYGFNLPVGTHFAAIKIEDEDFWEREVRGNEKMGFSIEGILGQKLVRMSAEFETTTEWVLETLTESEVAYIMDCYVEPGKGETEDEFIGRCMSKLVGDEGKEQDQSYAICKSIYENK